MSGAAALVVVVLLVGWAIWGVRAWPPLKRALAAGDRAALVREYRQTIIGQLVLSALAIGAAALAGFGIVQAGDGLSIGSAIEVGELPTPVLAGVGTALIGALLGVVVARRSSKSPPLSGDIAALLPVTGLERRWFIAVCLCVGVCEELLYRVVPAGWDRGTTRDGTTV